MEHEIFVSQLIKWYRHNGRDLPWRNTHDPYKIWLSEIILQQTRIVQGLPYYKKFIEAYPTVYDLANAREQEVLRLWQGLGYYSRARNLHTCARQVVNDYGGDFPQTYPELLKLKGIGKYTASAIASFAFGENKAVVDGNVFRVLSRVFGIEDDIADTKTFKVFETLADEIVKERNAADFNQGIMDFGAIQCTPKSPSCGLCPFSQACIAYNTGRQHELPVKSKKVKVRERHFAYLVFSFKGELLMKERGPKDVWQGLNDFPLIETKNAANEDDILSEIEAKGLIHLETSVAYKHVLTHQRIFARFYRFRVNDSANFVQLQNVHGAQPYSEEQINELPKPILIENYWKEEIL